MNIFQRLMLKSRERKALDEFMRIEYKNDYHRCKISSYDGYGYILDAYYNRKL